MTSSHAYCCPAAQARRGYPDPAAGRSDTRDPQVDSAVVVDREIQSILRLILGDGQDFSGHILLK